MVNVSGLLNLSFRHFLDVRTGSVSVWKQGSLNVFGLLNLSFRQLLDVRTGSVWTMIRKHGKCFWPNESLFQTTPRRT